MNDFLATALEFLHCFFGGVTGTLGPSVVDLNDRLDAIAHDCMLKIAVKRHLSHGVENVLHSIGSTREVVQVLCKGTVSTHDPSDGFFEVVSKFVKLCNVLAKVSDVLDEIRAALNDLLFLARPQIIVSKQHGRDHGCCCQRRPRRRFLLPGACVDTGTAAKVDSESGPERGVGSVLVLAPSARCLV
jgi:hypothetical protein